MTKLAMMLALAASAITLVPDPAAAASCTRQYVKCLNDSWYYSGSAQTAADVECAAEYAGCVARKWIKT